MICTTGEWAKMIILPIAAELIFALGFWLILYLNKLGRRDAQQEDEERATARVLVTFVFIVLSLQKGILEPT
jgi:hypothetical protein